MPIAARALTTGLLTALLPCGWLYLFALAAAGTGSPGLGAMVMAAFWLGTVPALLGLSTAARWAASRFRAYLPTLAAGLLIVVGLQTASGRGFANPRPLIESARTRLNAPTSTAKLRPESLSSMEATCAAVADELAELTKSKLPCCHEH